MTNKLQRLADKVIKEECNEFIGGWYNAMQDDYEEFKKVWSDSSKEQFIQELIDEVSLEVLTNENYKEIKFVGEDYITKQILEEIKDDEDIEEIADFMRWNGKKDKTITQSELTFERDFESYKVIVKGQEQFGEMLVIDEAEDNGEEWCEVRPLEFVSISQWMPKDKVRRI